MPNLDTLADLLNNLLGQATPRPDLLSESQGGPSFGSPSYRAPDQQQAATFLGRVVKSGDSLPQVLNRFPTGELEGGGLALGSLPQQLLPLATVIPARTANERMIQDLMKRAGLFAKAEADRRKFRTVAKKAKGVLGTYDPATNTITVDPRVLAGKKTPGSYKPSALEVVAHETSHALHNPRVAATSPAHALETAQQLATLMQNTPEAPLLQHYLERAATSNLATKTAQLLGTKLSAREIAALESVLPRKAFNESLSYLAQQGVRTDPDPLLKALAQAFQPK